MRFSVAQNSPTDFLSFGSPAPRRQGRRWEGGTPEARREAGERESSRSAPGKSRELPWGAQVPRRPSIRGAATEASTSRWELWSWEKTLVLRGGRGKVGEPIREKLAFTPEETEGWRWDGCLLSGLKCEQRSLENTSVLVSAFSKVSRRELKFGVGFSSLSLWWPLFPPLVQAFSLSKTAWLLLMLSVSRNPRSPHFC